jgi:hypothetical protein
MNTSTPALGRWWPVLYKVNFTLLINATDLSPVSSDWLKGRNIEESGRGLL